MKTRFIALLALAGVLAGLSSCSPRKSLEQELADRLAERAAEEARKLDPKRVEAEALRLASNLSPQQREQLKKEAQKLLNRL